MKTAIKSKNLLLAAICIFHSASHAAVVMTGTRIIYPSNQNEKTIQLQNKDLTPNIVQVWLDSGFEDSTPDHAEAPFIANPQIFKIQPNQGQMVRLVFTGEKNELPKDRETLYYLNFSEIPATTNDSVNKNKLMVVFKNRVKVFYRPEKLKFESHKIYERIHYELINSPTLPKVKLTNNSPYYANIAQVLLNRASRNTQISKNSMIEPYGSLDIPLSPRDAKIQNFKIHLNLINDYGIIVSNEIRPKVE